MRKLKFEIGIQRIHLEAEITEELLQKIMASEVNRTSGYRMYEFNGRYYVKSTGKWGGVFSQADGWIEFDGKLAYLVVKHDSNMYMLLRVCATIMGLAFLLVGIFREPGLLLVAPMPWFFVLLGYFIEMQSVKGRFVMLKRAYDLNSKDSEATVDIDDLRLFK